MMVEMSRAPNNHKKKFSKKSSRKAQARNLALLTLRNRALAKKLTGLSQPNKLFVQKVIITEEDLKAVNA